MRKIIAPILAASLLLTVLTPIPLTSALSEIAVHSDKTVYVAGEAVYIFGTIGKPVGDLPRVNITVASPSGGVWASVFIPPDPEGDFGVTVGSISELDSTGTYVVTATYLALKNVTTFQVKTIQKITVNPDKLVYLIGEPVTVSGRVSPLIEDYRVTLRIGPNGSCTDECGGAVGQVIPESDGSYVARDFYTVRSIDNGNWIVNATYGPLAHAAVSIYVGVKIIMAPVQPEYLPGQLVNITGTVSPMISGPLKVEIKNPSGGVWLSVEETLDYQGKFNVTGVVYPGDQVGNYTVSASYWGVSNSTSFLVGHLGSSTLSISTLGIYDASGDPVLRLQPGSTVRVRATLINTDIVTHEFVFIIQIKDSSGRLVFIAFQSSSLNPSEFVGQTAGQPFSDKDTYTVEVFVWDSWENANPLTEVHTLQFKII